MKRDYQPGSIFEFKSSKGYHYLQYAHLSESEIPLVGILTLERTAPIENLSEIGEISYRYFVRYHFPSAASQRLIRFVGTQPIPEQYQAFPPMRVPGHIDASGNVICWFIYKVPLTFHIDRLQDPAVRYRVWRLSEEEKRLSIGTIINHSLLVERIDFDWSNEDEDLKITPLGP